MGWDTTWAYLLAQADVVVHYLRLAIVPSPLVFLYDWPLGTSLGAVAWQAALLAALVAVTAVGVARRHPASFLGVWFFLILAPSSSVLQSSRRSPPSIACTCRSPRCRRRGGGRVPVWPSTGAFDERRHGRCGNCGPRLCRRARGRNAGAEPRVLERGDPLGRYGREETQRRAARVAYGEALANAGRLADAEAQYRTAIALAPDDPAARVRMGAVLAQQGRIDEAVPHLERAVALRPRDPDANRILAEMHAARGQDLVAVRHLDRRSRKCLAMRA